jgi:hypothetical protein
MRDLLDPGDIVYRLFLSGLLLVILQKVSFRDFGDHFARRWITPLALLIILSLSPVLPALLVHRSFTRRWKPVEGSLPKGDFCGEIQALALQGQIASSGNGFLLS